MKALKSAVVVATAFAAGAGSAAAQILEEITVTAQKRSESVQDVPVSITAFGGGFLEDNGIQTIDGVANITPNFQIQPSAVPTNNRINIRGISSVGNTAVEPSVGVYVDGVYYPRPGSVIGLLTDIQTFEVLRGPQGTLFGRNTPIGALNITTRNPVRETEGRVEVGAGNYGLYQVGGTFNSALSDQVAGRITFQYADRDGYGDNTFDGEEFGERDDLLARGKLRFDLSDSTSALLAVDYAEVNVGGSAVELVNDTVTPRFLGTVAALYGDTPATEDDTDWTINQIHDDQLADEQYGVSLDVSHTFESGVSLRSITAYRDWEAATTDINDLRLPASLFIHDTTYQTETVSQEFQLTSPGGETIDWLLGAFYYGEDYTITERRDLGTDYCVPTIAALLGPEAAGQCLSLPQDDAILSDFDQTLESFAVFGQGTWNITETLSATAGLRWTSDQKEGDFVSVILNPFAAVARLPEQALGMERDDSQVTGMANLSWYASEDTMLFATYSTGYKSGGFNSQGVAEPITVEDRIFSPEETENYELGVKSTLLDGRMTANATLFRTDINDFQDRSLQGGLSLLTINAGELRQQGLEADVNVLATENLRFVFGLAYLDSEYLEFTNAPALPGEPPGSTQDLTGERSNRSPEWQGSVTAQWSQPIANGLELFLGGSASWVDDQNLGSNSNNNPQSIQGAYTLVNAHLGLRSLAGGWNVALFGNNLTDEGYCTSFTDQAFGGSLGAVDPETNTVVQRCVLGAPQVWNIRATYDF